MRTSSISINDRLFHRTFVMFATLVLIAAATFAQSQAETTSKPPPRPEDALMAKLREARKDPSQTVDLIVKLVQEFPDSSSAESAGFLFASALKLQAKLDNDPAKLAALAARYIAGTTTAPPLLGVRIHSRAVSALLDNSLLEPAVELARNTVSVLDETQYVAHERQKYGSRVESNKKRDPNYKPRPFDETRAHLDFRLAKISYYTSLGRGYLKLGKTAAAEESYATAYQTDPVFAAAAAVGLATILEQRGNDRDALEYLARAALNGRMDKAGIAQFRSLYSKTHGGKLDGVEDYLDSRYRETYRNPVKGEKYRAEPGRTDRIVLAEFFTGAGCIPCIPFDYSFERALEDYSRNELALLVYHWHAPSLDPMGNRSSDARVKYYGVVGAPTVFLNGERFSREEDSTANEDRDPNTARRAYAALNAKIRANLKTHAEPRIKLAVKRDGLKVMTGVTTDRVKDLAGDFTLHVALIENAVTYSGENGLRFHPMVVRSLARSGDQSDYGFKIVAGKASRFEHVFDLDKISAENLRYYDEWPVERNKEVNARMPSFRSGVPEVNSPPTGK
jgi:tetratricopeptide (TPR) repeat protein